MQTGTFVTIVLARGSFSTGVAWYGVARSHGGNTDIQVRYVRSSLLLSKNYVRSWTSESRSLVRCRHVFSPGQRRSACQRYVRVTATAFPLGERQPTTLSSVRERATISFTRSRSCLLKFFVPIRISSGTGEDQILARSCALMICFTMQIKNGRGGGEGGPGSRFMISYNENIKDVYAKVVDCSTLSRLIKYRLIFNGDRFRGSSISSV